MVPMMAAIALSLFRVERPRHAALGRRGELGAVAHDPLARQALTVTAKVVVYSWVVQTPIAMALGLFTAGRQRYRSVYAALYVLPLLLSTAGIALMWEALLDPNFGGITALSRSLNLGFLRQNWLGTPSITLYVIIARNRLAVHPVPRAAVPDGPPADPGRAVRGGAP